MAFSDQVKKLRELNLNEIDLSDLDFENIGSWPIFVKIALAILVFIVVLGAGHFFHLSALRDAHSAAVREEEQLKSTLETKAFQAANLEAYRSQMVDMENSFAVLLEQLPKDTEVPGLLEDITHTGLGAGLEFDSINLKRETEREFYVELPIEIVAQGGYHDIAAFVSGVSALPRIVTLHDFTLTPIGNSALLRVRVVAKTYRYKGGDR